MSVVGRLHTHTLIMALCGLHTATAREKHNVVADIERKYEIGSRAYDEHVIRQTGVTIYHPSEDDSFVLFTPVALTRTCVFSLFVTSCDTAGTAKMTSDRSDPMGVCDVRGRVRNVKRLRVADLSLCPEIPGANTMLPAYMIGERVAAFVIADNE